MVRRRTRTRAVIFENGTASSGPRGKDSRGRIKGGEAQLSSEGHSDVKIRMGENIQTSRHEKGHVKIVKASKCIPHRPPACEYALSVKLELSTGGPACFGRHSPQPAKI